MRKTIFVPSLSGVQYGFNSSAIAGALLFIKNAFQLSPLQEGLLVGLTMLGMCAASLAGVLANRWGRVAVLRWSAGFFLLGVALSSLATSYIGLLLGRLTVGIASGMAIVVAPLYLVESAPAAVRGAVLNSYQLGVAGGSLLAYLTGYLFGFGGHWRWMFALGVIPALAQWIGLGQLPETVSIVARGQGSWKIAFDKRHRRRLLLTLALAGAQALTGSGAVFFFSPEIFRKSGFEHNPLLATFLVGTVYFSAVWVSFKVIDKLGRRPLLLTSLAGMGGSLVVIGRSFLQDGGEFGLLLAVLSYVGFYSLGMGPIPPLVVGEISPDEVRGHLMTLMGGSIWLLNYAVAVAFLPLSALLGYPWIFFLFSGLCFAGLCVFFVSLPETASEKVF
jgi:MFS family permease